MTETVTYRIFGIPVWSVTRTVPAPPPAQVDEEELYKRFAERFGSEMTAALRSKGLIQ